MLFFPFGELYPQLAPHESPLNVVVSRLLWSWWFCHRRQLALGPGMTNGNLRQVASIGPTSPKISKSYLGFAKKGVPKKIKIIFTSSIPQSWWIFHWENKKSPTKQTQDTRCFTTCPSWVWKYWPKNRNWVIPNSVDLGLQTLDPQKCQSTQSEAFNFWFLNLDWSRLVQILIKKIL